MDESNILLKYGHGNIAKIVQNYSTSSSSSSPSKHIDTNFDITSARTGNGSCQIKQTSVSKSSQSLLENQLFIQCTSTQWSKYIVEFQPIVTSRTTRFTMLNHVSIYLGELHVFYDGQFIYVPQQLSKPNFCFHNTTECTPSDIHIRFISKITIEEVPIDFINMLFRLAIDEGRALLINSRNRNSVSQGKIPYWNGTVTCLEQRDGGILLTLNFLQKSSTTCYQELERFCMSKIGFGYQEAARRELMHQIVLTRYDNQTHRIVDVDFQLTPARCRLNDDSKTTLTDYYLNKFDITIEDPDQPLIVYCPRRPSDSITQNQVSYLIPELCYLTGLSDRAQRDVRARKIHQTVRLNAAARQAAIHFFDGMIRRNSATIKYLASCGIEIISNHIVMHTLSDEPSHQKISSNDLSIDDDEENDDNDHSYGHFTRPVELKRWLLIYPKVDEDRALIYVHMLRQVARQHGMLINEPIHIEIDDDETETYASAIRHHLTEQIQLVSVIVKSRRVDRYNAIKRICCIEMPTPTEIILRGTIADDDILPSVSLNIARDINLKLGGQTRPANINIPNAMLISLASWTSAHANYQSSEHLDYVLAIVGTLNYDMSEYFSHAKSYTNEDDLRSDVGCFVRLAIDEYYKENEIYPTTIIIGRNVSSSFDDLNLIKNVEIQSIIDAITLSHIVADYTPRIILFTCMKQMIYDFYNYVQPKKIANVDCLTMNDSPSYCIYISSNRNHCSTLKARQFLVLFDNTDLSAQKVQRLLLYLTAHIPQRNQYFVPSICRFAQRLSSLVGETLCVEPDFLRYKNLFYL